MAGPEDDRRADVASSAGRILNVAPSAVARALRLVWQADRGSFLAVSLTQLVAGGLLALQVVVLRDVLALVVDGDADRSATIVPVVLLTVVFVGATLATVVQTELSPLLAERTARRAKDEVLEVAVAVDLETYDRSSFHDLMARAHLAAGTRVGGIARTVVALVGAVVSVVGIAIGVVVVEPRLVPLVVLGAVPMAVVAFRNARLERDFVEQLTPQDRERNYLWNALVQRSRAKEVRAYDAGAHLRDRHDELYDERIEAVVALRRRRLVRRVVGLALGAGVTGVTVWLVVGLVVDGTLDAAAAGAALAGLLVLVRRLGAAVDLTGTVVESALLLQDLEDFVALRPPPDAPTDLPPFERVAVRGVAYRYPDEESFALRGVDLDLAEGEVVALVGENGSGKSTMAAILAGLLRPTMGTVTWDEQDLADVPLAAVRDHVAVLFQDFTRWSMTVRENIGLGRPLEAADDARVAAAAGAAGAAGMIREMTAGYDTMLGKVFEGSTDLSGGQWQRLALARAVFRNTPLLILDEPSSALDPRAEAELFASMRAQFPGRTILLISHRLGGVRDADRIVVLHEGLVVEQGTHRELLELEGHYRRLHDLQRDGLVDV